MAMPASGRNRAREPPQPSIRGNDIGHPDAEREKQQRHRDVAQHLDGDDQRLPPESSARPRPARRWRRRPPGCARGQQARRRIEQAGAKEKCSVFSTMNRMTAAGSAFRPRPARRAAGRCCRKLLKSIGGTRVLGWMPTKRAIGQASRPQVASTRNHQRQRRVGPPGRRTCRPSRQRPSRHEDIHVQPIGDRHFRLVLAAIEIAGSNNAKMGNRIASRRKLRLCSSSRGLSGDSTRPIVAGRQRTGYRGISPPAYTST